MSAGIRKVLLLAIGFVLSNTSVASMPKGLEHVRTTVFHKMPLLTLSPKEFYDLYKTWPDEDLEDMWRMSFRQELSFESIRLFLKSDSKLRRTLALTRYGISDNTEKSEMLPPMPFVSSKKLGKEVWSPNCFLCHSNTIEGRFVVGAPNAKLDVATFVRDLSILRYGTFATNRILNNTPCFPFGTTRGTSDAGCITMVNTSFRDENLNPTLRQSALGEYHAVDEDTPTWWNMKYRTRMYHDSSSPFLPRSLMPFMISPDNSAAEIKAAEPVFNKIWAGIKEVENPGKFPGMIDLAGASRGKALFQENCAECHGSYTDVLGEVKNYPEKMVSIKRLGTDDRLLVQGDTEEHLTHYSKTWMADYGKYDIWIKREGYNAPALIGLWASGPYLHNGSVPTVYHVLFPDERPTIWKHVEDRLDFDKLGIAAQTVQKIPEKLSFWASRSYVDTRKFSKSNDGHLFPEVLSRDERMDVLEYLKTL